VHGLRGAGAVCLGGGGGARGREGGWQDEWVRVYLGADHAGFELKTRMLERLTADGHDLVDVGAFSYQADDDYPPYCLEAARRVVADPGSLGVVIGGSGNGEQIAANKVIGCRAALAWNTETAMLARQHNNAQVVAVGARMHTPEGAIAIVETFLATPFSGDERHIRRIGMLADYEATGKIVGLPGE
jgi:ribose 5-phosphate isomerase B